jgi:hypothetical protein
VGFLVLIGMKGFADKHMAFTAPQFEMIEGLRQTPEFFLVGQFVGEIAERFPKPVVGAAIDALEHAQYQLLQFWVLACRVPVLEFSNCGMQQIM